MNAQGLIERLHLAPHPEGGWFREIHRAAETVQTPRGVRSALTTIYYLLEREQLSRWHVVQSDEIWHFYAGAPLELVVYDPATRTCKPTVLEAPGDVNEPAVPMRPSEWRADRELADGMRAGREPAMVVRAGELPAQNSAARTASLRPPPADPSSAGREPVGIVRAGEWQAARSLGEYTLVGCNVGPGFDFADFQFVAALAHHADHFTGELSRYRTLL